MNTRRIRLAFVLNATILSVSMPTDVLAQQATMQFPVQRETSIDGWDNHDGYGDPPEYDKYLETEEFTNFGATVAIRARKSTQHAAIMDWDTDAINAFIASSVDTTKSMNWTLNVYPLGGPPDDVPIETLESLNDWVEGNGGYFDFDEDGDDGQYENFNWEPGTKAVTTNFAQTAFVLDEDGDPVLDTENSLPWIDDDSGTGGIDDNQYGILARADNYSPGVRIPNFVNSELLLAADLGDAAAEATYASVPLDADFVAAILTDPVNRGIIFGSIASNENWEIYARENDGFGGLAEQLPGPLAAFLELTFTPGAGGVTGDFDSSGVLDLPDIDALTQQSASGNNVAEYDLTGDALVDTLDVNYWISDLFNSWIGDANLDGEFTSGDLVNVLSSGTYEADVDSVWSQGDFNGDGRTNSGDLVAALAGGGYEVGPPAAVATVPEPGTLSMLTSLIVCTSFGYRRCLSKRRGC